MEKVKPLSGMLPLPVEGAIYSAESPATPSGRRFFRILSLEGHGEDRYAVAIETTGAGRPLSVDPANPQRSHPANVKLSAEGRMPLCYRLEERNPMSSNPLTATDVAAMPKKSATAPKPKPAYTEAEIEKARKASKTDVMETLRKSKAAPKPKPVHVEPAEKKTEPEPEPTKKKAAPKPSKKSAEPKSGPDMTDAEVNAFITAALKKDPETGRSAIVAAIREAKRSCGSNRFGRLFHALGGKKKLAPKPAKKITTIIVPVVPAVPKTAKKHAAPKA